MNCIRCGTNFEFTSGACPQCSWDPDHVHNSMAGFRPGELIRGRYEVQESLGVGCLGTVLKVTDLDVGMEVALKVIHPSLIPDHEAGRRFLTGVRKLTRVKNESTARVFDVNCEGDRYFLVRQLLDGVSLDRLIKNRRMRGHDFCLNDVIPVMEQLVELAADGFIHGSLCPRKIWILTRHLKTTDAGIAQYLPGAAVWHRLGTDVRFRGYIAPELKQGSPVSRQSDVYSIAALLGEMLTQVSFDGRAEIFSESDPDLPREIDAVLRCGLNPNPDGRYETAEEFLQCLNDATGSGSPSLVPSEDTMISKNPFDSEGNKQPESLTFERPDPTMQVSMEDVIRAHVEKSPAIPVVAEPVVPPRRETKLDALAKATLSTPKPITPVKPRRISSIPSTSSKKSTIPPPGRISAGRPTVPKRSAKAETTEVTTEIALSEIEPVREVTQEIDISMLESDNANQAAEKLEQQALSADRQSSDELIRRAERLDGVDPRFIRAAHSLESDRRGKSSKQAAEILRNRAESDDFEGIDPRLLRAAARLESARISEVPVREEEEVATNSDDSNWREKIPAKDTAQVISFLAPPVIENSACFQGFPRSRQPNKPPKMVAPKRTAPAASRRREPHTPSSSRVLYDDSGETDEDSQPTIRVRVSKIPRANQYKMQNRRIRTLEATLPALIVLLFVMMVALLVLAFVKERQVSFSYLAKESNSAILGLGCAPSREPAGEPPLKRIRVGTLDTAYF